MAVSLKHTTTAVGTDAGNGEIAKAEWNEEHTLTLDSGKLLGRTTAGAGAVEEVSLLDEDDMASDSATAVPTQQSVKAYVDNNAGGSKIIATWTPTMASFPVSNYATLDTRNTHPVLDFDTTTAETVYFHGVMPDNYGTEGVTVELWCAASTATSGTVGWLVAFEKLDGLDIDGDSFASDQTIATVTVPATAGEVFSNTDDISDGANMDSLAAGDAFRMKVTRNVSVDNAAGDAELLLVQLRIQ
jgi:hypothetical protein